jgi:hypothetical protein
MRSAAATRATSQSPQRSELSAVWRAANDEEHAVSTTRDGPSRPRRKDMRLAAADSAEPVVS